MIIHLWLLKYSSSEICKVYINISSELLLHCFDNKIRCWLFRNNIFELKRTSLHFDTHPDIEQNERMTGALTLWLALGSSLLFSLWVMALTLWGAVKFPGNHAWVCHGSALKLSPLLPLFSSPSLPPLPPFSLAGQFTSVWKSFAYLSMHFLKINSRSKLCLNNCSLAADRIWLARTQKIIQT